MATHGYVGQVIDYKQLLFYHLSVVSRASANLQAAEEKQLMMGQDPAKSFWQSVKTLEAFLSPYFDDKYKEGKKEISEKENTKDYFGYGVKLLAICMQLLDRKGWALIEDVVAETGEIDVNTDYAKLREENQKEYFEKKSQEKAEAEKSDVDEKQ